MRRFLLPGLAGLALAAVFFFTLKPNLHNDRTIEFPRPIGRWLDAHDDWANFLAFALFGSLVFAVPESRAPGSPPTRKGARLGLLLALVSGLEVAQHWIPGRISSWRDVATGSSGVFCAWLADRFRPRRR